MMSFGLSPPFSIWLDHAEGLPMPCVGGCSASFVQKTRQQTHFSGILSKGKPLRILQLSWWLHVTTLPGPYTDSSRMPHVRVSSLWVLAGMLWKTRQVSRLVMPSSSSLTTSLPHVDRGGVTAAAASSGVGWRQCGLNLVVERSLRIFGCCPQDGRTRPARLPDPRTTDHATAFA